MTQEERQEYLKRLTERDLWVLIVMLEREVSEDDGEAE